MLATTATANARVTADVAAQLGGGHAWSLRGPLARALAAAVGRAGARARVERVAWVADALAALPGSGMVYG